MKSKLLILLIAVACFTLFAFSGCRIGNRSRRAETKPTASGEAAPEAGKAAEPQAELSITSGNGEGIDLPEKEEIRRKFQFEAAASINVTNINGSVTVETADANTAEVLIVRSAKTREDLENYRKVNIEQQENRLRIGIENDRKSLFSTLGKIPEGRQRVVLKIPRKVNFNSYNVNGNVTLGEIQGRVGLHEINGQIKAARFAGQTAFGNINGGIDATFAQLNGKGLEVFDVNGNVDLRFEGAVNADLNAWSITGQLNPDLPNVEASNEEPGRGRLKARIGTGGTQIRINNINGNVNLLKAEKTSTQSAKVASK